MVALRLKLDNVTNLPDGGPTSLEVEGRRSIDIGRNTYLDWTLPDPARVVSGRHCEIHYRDGGYWLTDISTNGTFLNGSDSRVTEPTRLKTGDRIAIGDYLINVTVQEDASGSARTVEAPAAGPAEAASGALWDVSDERAAPAERADRLKARAAKPVHADVLDWISDLPTPEPQAAGPAEPADAPAEAPADDFAAPGEPGEGDEAVAAAPEPAEAVADETLAGADETIAEADETFAGADRGALWEPVPDIAPEPPMPPEAPEPPMPAETAERPEAEPERGFGPAVRADEPPAPVRHGAEFERFAVALAAALDLPRDRLEAGSPEELAQKVGTFVNLTIGGMQRLLKARAASRGHMRAGPGTQVQAVGNNPLKFMPTPGAAADVLFGARSRSYLGIEETLDESFADLGAHQMALYRAMQGAVERMLKDLDPAAIEAGESEERGFALPGSKKSKFWDTYKERYNARASQHDNGMVDVFMMCFSDAYDRAINNRD